MTPFVEKRPDARWAQVNRARLLAQPAEFFQQYHHGRTPDLLEKVHFVERMLQAAAAPLMFENDVYLVHVEKSPPYVHLTISRHDELPSKSWSDFQRIKNELVGPECEAMELYPAESRLVDTRNEYHLWVIPNAAVRFPVGHAERRVWNKPLT